MTQPEPIASPQRFVEGDQVWPKMAAKCGVDDPVPPWKPSLDGLCDALDNASCSTDTPTFEERRDEEDALSATVYSGLPYPENKLVSLAHSLLARGVISEAELEQRLGSVRTPLQT